MKHARGITKVPVKKSPQYAETVCGRYTPTGKVKCVDSTSPKAEKIETIPVP